MRESLEKERAIGAEEKAVCIVQNLITRLDLPLEEACELADITPETYREYFEIL